MHPVDFDLALENILKKDDRYSSNAYVFIRKGLDFTVGKYKKKAARGKQHVRGGELLKGLHLFALEQFGPMSKTVLNQWGVHTTRDIGEIVFNLVNEGVLGKTEEDSMADFNEGYSFDEAFRQPYLPESQKKNTEKHLLESSD